MDKNNERTDWRPTRIRNSVLEVCIEGTVLVHPDNTYQIVESGEIRVYADGTIDSTNGELSEITDSEVLPAGELYYL